MIDGVAFSDKGDAPTEFEARLVTQSAGSGPLDELARRLVRDLGLSVGVHVLAIVLDELGGESLYLPQRAHYFRELWRAERDALVLDLSSRPDWTTRDIAEALGMSPDMVRHVRRQRSRGGQRRARDTRAAR